jgi:hypothetical protein
VLIWHTYREAIQAAVETYMTNAGGHRQKSAFSAKKVTVAAALKYIKKVLKSGISWDAGVRKLVSLYYRGSIIYALLVRFLGYASGAYKHIAWAVEFIDEADRQFHVTRDSSYAEKGSAFQPSLRRSIMLMQLETHRALRGATFELERGPFPVVRNHARLLSVC